MRNKVQSERENEAPSIAIIPWGDVIEDFLGPLGLEARSYLSTADGGWLFGYVAALSAQNFRPFILWGSSSVRAPEQLTHQATGATVWLYPAPPRPTSGSPALVSIRRWLDSPVGQVARLIRRERGCAIISQEYEDARFDRWIGLGRRLGIPVYATFQGGDRSASWLEATLRPLTIAKSAGLIVPSAGERNRLRQRYGRRLPPIADIPNPVDARHWTSIGREAARQMLGIAPTAFLAINHGRIDIFRKGLDVLLAAWTASKPREEDRLVLIGSGQDDGAFEKLIERRAPKGVDWHASYDTDRERIRTWLSASDVYVTASRIEGMPVAPLEAMACALPLLATDAQGLADILQAGEAHGGVLVAREDVSGLAAGLCRLREDASLRERLGRAARRRVETSYSLETVGRALGGFIRQPGGNPYLPTSIISRAI